MAKETAQKQGGATDGSPDGSPPSPPPAANDKTLTADAEQDLSESQREQVSAIVEEQLAEAFPPEVEREFPECPADIPDATAEACVEVAAVLTNRAAGIEPDGLTLLYKCGQRHVDAVEKAGAEPDAVAAWACAEARRRSPALNHKAIVAQSIV